MLVDDTFSWSLLLMLLFVFVLSCAMFWILALRDTTFRRRLAMSDWAKSRSFHIFTKGQADLPQPLASLGHLNPVVILSLAGGDSLILHLQTDPPPTRMVGPIRDHWRLLVRHTGGDWHPAGLRPTRVADSLLDRLQLQEYPGVADDANRLMPLAVDAKAAKTLARSPARTLLPPDVGLFLTGGYLVLDFSTRPFDPIEFDRMLAISSQLVAQLPAVAASS